MISVKRVFFLLTAIAVSLVSCEDKTDGKEDTDKPSAADYEYMVATLTINTEDMDGDGKPDWETTDKKRKVTCTVAIDHPNDEWDMAASTGYVRGRGNSTWKWYDKKPHRFKLDEKASVLGLDPEKDWVLLANYRDPSNLMNAFVFELGREMGLPYTNHSRYVELIANGEYLGLYQLTEQVEQGGNRVDVDDTEGYLICLDADDGPELSPGAGDNFWSKVYSMPVCVKHPEDDMTEEKYNVIRDDLARVETEIKAIRSNKGDDDAVQKHYDALKEIFDVKSFIDFLIIQELVYNVELAAPRSMYMHKDKGGKWAMGPLWDFDAGFDFDWGTMTTGHHYFERYQDLVLGTDPIHHTAGYYVPEFFTDIFRSDKFREEYRARWAEISPKIMTDVWSRVQKFAELGEDAWNRNAEKWPVYLDDAHPMRKLDWEDELGKMYVWLTDRIEHLTPVINNYKD